MHWFLSILTILMAATFAVLPRTAFAQRAGMLIAAQPVEDAPANIRAWRIEYWTSGDRNQPIRVTGMVIAPKERSTSGPRRVIAWTHGLIGIDFLDVDRKRGKGRPVK